MATAAKMPNYQLGKIYVVRNTVNDKLYVGSTTVPLSKRMAGHRQSAKLMQHLKMYAAMNEVGVDAFYIELVEDFPCERKEQLLAREGAKIRELNTVMNGYNNVIAGHTQIKTKKQYCKEWYDTHQENCVQVAQAYRDTDRAAYNASARARREAMTPEQREAMNAKQRRAALPPAVREARNAAQRVSAMTSEQVEARRAYDRARLAALTPEKHEARNAKMRKSALTPEMHEARKTAKRTSALTPAQLEVQRAHDRARNAARRAALTPEQREAINVKARAAYAAKMVREAAAAVVI